MRPQSSYRVFLVAMCAACLATPSDARPGDVPNTDDAPRERGRSVIARAAATGRSNTLVTGLYLTGLLDTLRGGGPFTLFAPTDEAFAKLSREDLAALLRDENQGKLAEILRYHVVAGRFTADELASRGRLQTLQGARLTVASNGRGVAVDGATVVRADIPCRNGIVHLIDSVLVPPRPDAIDFAAKNDFDVLVKAVKAAGLEDVLRGDGPFTVFAPTDSAFSKLGHKTLDPLLDTKGGRRKLAEILKLHVVAGRLTADELRGAKEVQTLAGPKLKVEARGKALAVGGVPVASADNEVGNGIVHAISGVILPPEAGTDILRVAADAGNFAVLAAALKATGLDDALKGDGPFTVFAPTDEAFAKLGKEKLAELTKPGNRDALAKILKYHVAAGRLPARELIAGGGARTLLGPRVEAAIEKGRLVIGGARAEASDVAASNGLIHAIDSVLIPE